MYRKIQFRGERIDNNEKIVGFFLGVNPIDIDQAFISADTVRFLVHTDSIGQYTGLNLKNGEYLFEGDLFQYKQHKGYIYKDFIGKVVFENGSFGFRKISGDMSNGFVAFSEIDELQFNFLDHISII